MSVKIMSLVWDRAPYNSSSLLVLLALADWANDDGLCWPSVKKLADKARIDRRSAQRIIRQLATDGFLKIDEGGGRAKQHRYFVQIETVTNCRPLSEINSDISNTQTATFRTQRAASETETATRMSPDPLVEPSDDPSFDPLRAPRDRTIKEWIPILTKERDKGNEILPMIESIENATLRKTLLEWKREGVKRAA